MTTIDPQQLDLFGLVPQPLAFPDNFEDCVYALEEHDARIVWLENELKDTRARQRYLSDHLLTDLVPDDVTWDARKHTALVTLPRTGRTVLLKKELHCSVAKDAREEAHQWLLDNGFDDLLKYQLVIQFPRKMLDVARSTYTSLRKLLDPVITIEGSTELAGATMAAFVRGRIKAGHHVPDCFGVYAPVRVLTQAEQNTAE